MAVGPDSRQRSGRLAHKSVLPIAVGIVKLARVLQRLKAIRSGRDGGPARGPG